MSIRALESERLTVLPKRLEMRRWGAHSGADGNFAFAVQFNIASQWMGSCVSNCTQVINQYNFVFIFQR